jgi:hypothetical protein
MIQKTYTDNTADTPVNGKVNIFPHPDGSLRQKNPDGSVNIIWNPAQQNLVTYNVSDYNELLLITGQQDGDMAYVKNSQGSKWLPGSLGGTYYPAGFYLYTGGFWVSDRNNIVAQLEQLKTGWAAYGDSQYTVGSPLLIPQGNTVILDIDGLGNTVKSQLPQGVTDFYDVATSKVTPENVGDYYTFSLGFQGSSSSNNGSATIGFDIGGAFGQIFKRNFRYPRGTGVTHDFYLTSGGYSLNTFVANGAQIKITSDVGISSLYNFTFHVARTHKAFII